MTFALETRKPYETVPTECSFEVDVVDSIGRPVSSIDVDVLYEMGDGSAVLTHHCTDVDGRAFISDQLPVMADAVEITVGREHSGPHSAFHRSIFVMEM